MKITLCFRAFFVCLTLLLLAMQSATSVSAQASKFDVAPLLAKYSFSPQQTPDNIVSSYSTVSSLGYSFQWQCSAAPEGTFVNIPAANTENLTFAAGAYLTANTFYRRVATKGAEIINSNTVRYELVSAHWEDLNYTREHTVLVPGQTTWMQVDQLPIGDKLVTTTYFDGMGRPLQQVNKEAATPIEGGTVWGDMVQHIAYDNLGRKPQQFLPYTTTANAGKFKTDAPTAVAAYYNTRYSDAVPYGQASFDNSPLNRVLNSKAPGAAWHASAGNSSEYLLNTLEDDVKRFEIGYAQADMPVLNSAGPVYAANTLFKISATDELGKKVIHFADAEGKLILKKVQLSDAPSITYSGWICTYYVYDDFGQLRCEINPEGVQWLNTNGWSFAATNGATVFAEQCFVYIYDDRGRTIYKKQPGQQYLQMVYDYRNRLVLTQDGNQRAKAPAEWTAFLYDELDRPLSSYLYRTNATDITLRQNAQNNATILTAAEQGNTSICTLLSTRFYDDYSFAEAVAFDQSAANNAAVAGAGPNILPIASTNRTTGFATGSQTRVLGTTTFLMTTSYYNENGNPIQTIAGNIKGGNDIATTQYGWDDRVLATASKHGLPGAPYHNYEILSKYNYDKIGRVTGTEQKFGTNAWRVMSNRTLDDFGRTASKRLSPAYNGHFGGIGPAGGGLENLAYTYNVQGSMVAINKQYALKETGYNKWGNFFGLYLSYADNGAGMFDNATRTNGQMRGLVWSTQGDDAQRRYQYTYDNAGRMLKASFSDKTNSFSGWSSAALNFTETGNNETTGIEYDLNGNLKNLRRYGHQMGQANAVTVDMLMYTYAGFSNKLTAVTDITSFGTPVNPATLGDFKEVNTGANDYVYDANGNLLADLNKGMKDLSGTNGIIYNHLDKPEQIKIVKLENGIDKGGTITITYDAAGAKLKRTFVSATQGYTSTTWYIGQYQYEEITGTNAKPFALSFIAFAEGRIRPVTPVNTDNGYDALTLSGNLTLPDGKQGSLDYFITDHRTDVRMILTEEVQWSRSTASMETAGGRNTIEEALYGSRVAATRVAKSEAPGWAGNTSGYISKLHSTQKTGPSQLLKVMAGDLLHTNVQYYYQQPTTNSSGSTVFADVLSMLAGAIAMPGSAAGSAVKNAGTAITNSLGSGTAFSQVISPDITSPNGDKPKAYLNMVFFDERFTFVAESSSSQRVQTLGDGAAPLALLNIKAPKNGYCLVYLSNESEEAVFFDNLQVRHDRGRILEENHYYAFGLKIAALSSKAFAAPNNNYQYQGDYAEFDDDLGWNDFALRSYDPQTGRFLQNDPYDQFASGYAGMGNDPGNNVDPSGGFSFGPFASTFMNHAFWTVGGAIVGGAINAANGGNGWNGVAIGAGVGLGASFVNWGAVGSAIGDAGKWIGNGAGSLFQIGAGKELLFKTVAEAAKHWGKTYNDNSIVEGREYGSTIYEETKKGKTSYKYSVPNKASSSGASVKVSKAPDGKKAVADIHSHGNSWGEDPGMVEADNNFSSTDKWSNYNQNIDGYLTTPDGSLKKYNYRTTKTSVISTDMPSDPKYPKLRKNKIDPFTMPKNEPFVLMR